MALILVLCLFLLIFFFFFNDTATTEIYTLSLHDALPISPRAAPLPRAARRGGDRAHPFRRDRKSTRLNSSHGYISYAVFCLKKKKTNSDLQLNATAVRHCCTSVYTRERAGLCRAPRHECA